MCIEDIAIARKTYPKRTLIAGGSTVSLEPNPNRIAVVCTVQATVSGDLVVATSSDDTANMRGLAVVSFGPVAGQEYWANTTLVLSYQHYGGAVMGPLYIRSSNASGVATEILMDDSLQRAVAAKTRELTSATR